MIQARESIPAALIAAVLLLGLSACQEQEGPAERAGKRIDQAVQRAGQEIEKAGQRLRGAASGSKK